MNMKEVDAVNVDGWIQQLSAWREKLQDELDELENQEEEEENDRKEGMMYVLECGIERIESAIEALENL
jgi:adenosylmethionine-8-amino-7-oxononanoate aminotransferase